MIRVEIQQADFDVAEEYAALCAAAPKAGAIVTFVGLVRDFYDDPDSADSIDHIELTHYAGMTEALCQQIVDEAHDQYQFDAATVIHRVGKLSAGEQIVLVAIASRHRDKGFAAAQFIMDYLKTRATLWKKEIGSRGTQWIGLKDKDAQAAERWSRKQTTDKSG